jgi:hypothetical protein
VALPPGAVPLPAPGQGDLAAIGDVSELQLAAEAGVVTGLQKTRAQITMHVDCRPNDFFTDWIGGMLDESHGPSWRAGPYQGW